MLFLSPWTSLVPPLAIRVAPGIYWKIYGHIQGSDESLEIRHVACNEHYKYHRPGGYSTLSWVRMCGPKFRTPPYNKTKEDANLLPISKPFVSLRALLKTNQCFLQCKLDACISTFWQPVDKPKDKFIGNYAFCKNATYIKTNFQIKKGPLQNLRARKSNLSGPHIPVPTFPLSTPSPITVLLTLLSKHWRDQQS